MKMRLFFIILLCITDLALYSQGTFQVIDSEWINLTQFMPKECKIQKSNNNVDVINYKNKYYLAFRTAPSHFPSKKANMYIVSSEDFQNWKLEHTFFYQKDIREPRFFICNDTLFLMFMTLTGKSTKFYPENIFITKTVGNGNWLDTLNIGLDGYVPWRVRNLNGKLYLSVYYGVGLYKKKHQADLRLLVSDDGNSWKKISEHAQIDGFSGEEGEFIFDDNQDLYAIVRLEGFGSYLCKSIDKNYSNWSKKLSKFKYDSSLLVNHKNEIYLISRRNIDGPCDKRKKERKKPYQGKFRNLIRYSFTKKVTAIFYLNKEKMELEWIKDFPSTGDNAFPAIAAFNENEYYLVNYSSNINKKKKNWIRGQLGKTYLYYTKLKFEKK